MTILVISWDSYMRYWQIQEAKAKFSEVLKSARQSGPQAITSHGKPVAVVLSKETFDQLTDNHVSLVDFIRNSPLYGVEEVKFERKDSLTREEPLF